MSYHRWFNPGKFTRALDGVSPAIWLIAVGTFAAGLYFSLIGSPADYQQGQAVRIMYVHVPAAWMSLMLYVTMAGFAAAGFIWRNPFSFMIVRAIAPIGLVYSLVCLITGSLWGKPMWGTWWVWDARLTSMLILFLFYVAYVALANGFDEAQRGEKMGAILVLIGLVNIPIIKFSVDWWSTLHQPASILRSGGIAIDSSMLTPLLIMFLFSFFLALSVFILRIKMLLMSQRLNKKALLVR